MPTNPWDEHARGVDGSAARRLRAAGGVHSRLRAFEGSLTGRPKAGAGEADGSAQRRGPIPLLFHLAVETRQTHSGPSGGILA